MEAKSRHSLCPLLSGLICCCGRAEENGKTGNNKLKYSIVSFSPKLPSVQFSCLVVSDSLRRHESQHGRPPCLSPFPRVHSDSHHRASDDIQPYHILSSPSPPAPIPPSIRVFSDESTLCMRWSKY